MISYVIKRILKAIPLMIVLSIILFFIIGMIPGDFVDAKSNPNMSVEKVENLKEIYGLDKPLPARYVSWMSHAVKGDFGDSLKFNQPVSTVINTYVWNSFLLAITSFIITLLISIPVGITSAVKQYSGFDKVWTFIAFFTMSAPSFFLAMVLMKIFSIDLKVLPIGGMITAGADYTGMEHGVDVIKHMVLPVITLTVLQVGSFIRYVRTSMLEVVKQDYVRTARAKGLKEKVVIYRHVLRNGLIPIVTFIGLSIPSLFAGAIITETVFVWPGIGKVAYDAINNRDYTLLMGFNMFMGLLTILGNLISDVLYAVVDPRIKLK